MCMDAFVMRFKSLSSKFSIAAKLLTSLFSCYGPLYYLSSLWLTMKWFSQQRDKRRQVRFSHPAWAKTRSQHFSFSPVCNGTPQSILHSCVITFFSIKWWWHAVYPHNGQSAEIFGHVLVTRGCFFAFKNWFLSANAFLFSSFFQRNKAALYSFWYLPLTSFSIFGCFSNFFCMPVNSFNNCHFISARKVVLHFVYLFKLPNYFNGECRWHFLISKI